MGCEICGRGNCTRSFHSLEEQEEFDTVNDKTKDRMRDFLVNKINRLKTISNYEDNNDNEDYVKLSDVIGIIENYS
jgi:hypothetical protein